jgi:hypothetical protein
MTTYVNKYAAWFAAQVDLGDNAELGRDFKLSAQTLPSGREVWTWEAIDSDAEPNTGTGEFDDLGVKGTALTEDDDGPTDAEIEALSDSGAVTVTQAECDAASFQSLLYRHKVRRAREVAFGPLDLKFAVITTHRMCGGDGQSVYVVAAQSLEDAKTRVARGQKLHRLFTDTRIIVVDSFQWEAIRRGDWDCHQYNPEQHALKLTENEPI